MSKVYSFKLLLLSKTQSCTFCFLLVISVICGEVSGLNLCTAQDKGLEQVQGDRLGPATLGTLKSSGNLILYSK